MTVNVLRLGISADAAKIGAREFDAAAQKVGTSAEKAAKGVNKTEKSFNELGAASSQLKSVLGALGITLGALEFLRQAKDATLLAARYETLGIVMDVVGRNANKSSREMAELETALRKTGISAVESRNNLARMVGAQIDLANATDLARIAQDAAVIAGLNSSDAFEQLVTGISTGQSRILRTMGLFVDFDAALEKYARTLGVAKDDLTEFQATQARANAVLEGAGKIAGSYTAAMDTAGKQSGSMKRLLDDLRMTIGTLGMDAFTEAVFGTSGALKSMQAALDGVGEERLKKWAGVLADAAVALGTAGLTGALILATRALWLFAAAEGAALLGALRAVPAFLSLLVTVRSLAGAIALMEISLGPVGWLLAGLTAVAAGVYAWRRAHRGQVEELDELAGATTRSADALARYARVLAGLKGPGVLPETEAQITARIGRLTRGMEPPFEPTPFRGRPDLGFKFELPVPAGLSTEKRTGEDVIAGRTRHLLPPPDLGPFTAGRAEAPGMFGQIGKRTGGGIGGAVMGGLESAMSTLGQGFRSLWAQFGPAGLALAAVFDIVSAAMEPLQPVIDALREPLKVIGKLIGQNLAPILQLLVPVLKAVAKAFTYVQQATGYYIQALGWLIDHLVPDFISKIGQGIEQYGKDMVANSKAARNAIGATNEFADALKAATVNIPTSLPLAYLRQQFGMGGLPGTGGTGGTGTTGGGPPGGRRPGRDGDETRVTYSFTGNTFYTAAKDGEEFLTSLETAVRKRKGSGSALIFDRYYQLRTT